MKVDEILNEAIKLSIGGGSKNKEGLNAFFKEFDAATKSNPFQPRMRVWKDSIGFEISEWQGKAHIGSIMSFIEKNAGQASAGLKWVCELADKHHVIMDLQVKPIKNAGAVEGKSLNKAQLTQWYTRNGFVKTHSDSMERKPK